MEMLAKKAGAEDNPDRTSVVPKILLVFASLVATSIVGEIAVRVIVAALYRYPLLVTDSHAGWTLKPNVNHATMVVGGSKFAVTTDNDGHRICYPIGQPPPIAAPILIVVGDSLAQGIGVNDDQTFAWALARSTPYNVVNLAVLGYGTDQELVRLEDFFAARPSALVKHIIVLIFDNDFSDAQTAHTYLGRSKPLFSVSGQELVRPKYEPSWADHLMDVSRLFWLISNKYALISTGPRPPTENGIDVVLACLKAMRRLAESRGAELHLFAYHRLKESPPLTSSQWERFVAHAGAVDITERVRAARGPDPTGPDGVHWNAVGHALVAKILSESLKEEATSRPHSESSKHGSDGTSSGNP
jgi:hypothetical protein